jgi:hypothetical protein
MTKERGSGKEMLGRRLGGRTHALGRIKGWVTGDRRDGNVGRRKRLRDERESGDGLAGTEERTGRRHAYVGTNEGWARSAGIRAMERAG